MKYILLVVFIQISSICDTKSQVYEDVPATVLKIDSTKYYHVYLIKRVDTCQVMVLLAEKSKKNRLKKDCKGIIMGGRYNFSMHSTSIFKDESGKNIIYNLRGFRYGNVFSIEAGEFPFIATNVFDSIVCESKVPPN